MLKRVRFGQDRKEVINVSPEAGAGTTIPYTPLHARSRPMPLPIVLPPKDVKELKNQFNAFKWKVTGTRGNIKSEIQKLFDAVRINARPHPGVLGNLRMPLSTGFINWCLIRVCLPLKGLVNEKLHACQISTLRWALLSRRFDQPVVLHVRGDRLDSVHAHQEVLKVTAKNPLKLINLHGFQRGIAQVREWQLSFCNAYFGLEWASVHH